jgi:hypothetical protein
VSGSALALYVSTLALTALVVWRARTQLSVVSAFSAVWILLIAIPSAIGYTGVESLARERLFWATAIVNVVLALTVVARWSRPGRTVATQAQSSPAAEPTAARMPWLWPLLALSVTAFLIHAALMPKIPLVELARGSGLTANQLTELREAANKLLPLPLAVKYLLYWNVRVVVPTLLCALIVMRAPKYTLVFVPVLLVLSSLTLEKSLPTFAIIAAGLGIATLSRLSILSRPLVVSFLIALAFASGLQTATKIRDVQARGAMPPGAADPSSTKMRARDVILYPFQFTYHRILTGPSGVAYAWFEYFPDVHGGFLRGQSWSPFVRSQPGFQHPANLVGLYAYHQRNPERYLETAYAYAAFHADAWANFGYAGVLVAALGAAGVLLLVDFAVLLADSPLTAGATGAAFSILLTTLPGGGLQAALVAQGLLPALVVGLLPLWRRRGALMRYLPRRAIGYSQR